MNLHLFITRGYQYAAEVIVVYFLLVPFFIYYNFLPFGKYLIVAALVHILFSLLRLVMESYLSLLIVVPAVGFAANAWLGFPVFLACLAAVIFYWRIAEHQKEADKHYDVTLLSVSLTLVLVEVIFTYDDKIIWMAMIQIVIFTSGYWLSQLTAQKRSVKLVELKVLALYLSLSVSAGLLFWIMYSGIRFSLSGLWTWGTRGVVFLISALLYLAGIRSSFTNEGDSSRSAFSMDTPPLTLTEKKSVKDLLSETTNSVSSIHQTVWIILLGLVLILAAYVLFRRKLMSQESFEHQESTGSEAASVTYYPLKETPGYTYSYDHRPPEQYVRKEVFQLESLAREKGKGRKPSETLQNWLRRLRVDEVVIELYEKVRYGEQPLSSQEKKVFTEAVRQLKDFMNHSSDEK